MSHPSPLGLLAAAVISLAAATQETPTPPSAPAGTEWKLPSGLALRPKALDVSPDRKWAVVWGRRGAGAEVRRSCWLTDLQTGKTDDLLAQLGDKTAASIQEPKSALFSPDGQHLLISATDGKSACIVDLATSKSVPITRPDGFQIMWAGKHLLLSAAGKPIETCDVTGQRVEELKLRGQVLACDLSGNRLLARITPDEPAKESAEGRSGPILAVVTPDGKVLQEVGSGGSACPADMPLMSRSGNWAGIYCNIKGEWSYSLVSTVTHEALRIKRPWGTTLALTDAGDSIFMASGKNNTYIGPTRDALCCPAEGYDVVFWPKDDDPYKSVPGGGKALSEGELFSNKVPRGKSQVLAKGAMAVALLGEELFFVQMAGDERTLKAIALPKAQEIPAAR